MNRLNEWYLKLRESEKGQTMAEYGLILVAVLAGFGITAFQLERGHVFHQVDEELQRRLGALTGALRQSAVVAPRRRRLSADFLQIAAMAALMAHC